MKCICVTGASQPELDFVAEVLQRAGMRESKPATRTDAIDIHSWHEQVLAMPSHDEEEAGQLAQNPGRFMEQLASDVFVANLNSEVWGWADTRSSSMLDFWLNFDPRVYFVLVCVSPQQMLANEMNSTDELGSVGSVMDRWLANYRQLIRFHLRNPQRSLLVAAGECYSNPERLISLCAPRWKLPLQTPAAWPDTHIATDAVALYLAQQACKEYPQVEDLQHELLAARTCLDENATQSTAEALIAERIITDYRELKRNTVESAKLETAYAEIADLKASVEAVENALKDTGLENDQLLLQLHQVQEEKSIHIKYAEEVTQALAELGKRLDEANEENARRIENGVQENELLLLQLHQVQEELEVYFLKHDELQNQFAQLLQSNQALEQEKSIHIKYAEEATQTLAELGKRLDEANEENARRIENGVQENELLLLQLHQVQEELEAYFLKHDELQKQFAQLLQSNQALEQEKSIHIKYAEEATQALAELGKRLEETNAENARRIENGAQENELLLLQLHQVQEELEHYFLMFQDKQKELSIVNSRWQRMQQRYPDYYDYESLEVLTDENNLTKGITWQLSNLNAVGRSFQHLSFRTVVEQGVAGLIFFRQPDNSSPLIRWPIHLADQDELIIIPVGNQETQASRIGTLINLATSDWVYLSVLIGLLQSVLKSSDNPIKLPEGLKTTALSEGLEKLKGIIEKFPLTLRYDQVFLKHQQINPDYEHLCLRLENLMFRGRCWSDFEFRISCANVGMNRFGDHPKLEFPEPEGQTPFESWFIESYDDKGAKLELRFALPDAMDVGVLKQLSPADREFMGALIARLPVMLLTLEHAGVKLARPWEEWMKMVKEMQRIFALQTEQNAAAVVTPPQTVKGRRNQTVNSAVGAKIRIGK